MNVELMKCKIHRAVVTDANLKYEGSNKIDNSLMDAAGLFPFETVSILDIANGARFDTYVIEGERDSGTICLNGAAARLVQRGDLVIIVAYASMTPEEAKNWNPTVIRVDSKNRILK